MERRDVADPFLVEEFLEVVLPYIEKDKKAGLSDLRAAVYRYYAENQRQIAMLSSESASGKAWVYYNKVVDMADSLSEKGMPELVKTLAQLSSVVWFRAGYTTVECTRRMKDRLALLMEDNRITGILDSATLCYARNAVSEFDRRLIRNGYLPDSTLLPRQEADSMILAQISEYEAMKQPTVKDVCVLNLLKWYKGQIDADSALLAASEYYRENTTYPRHIDAVQLGRLHTPLL
ncbi:MAG: hypothetical protein K2O12_00685, partial [Muribaculaceae bacterium]|nr:hypothetical protein [Muribaculaceae bacterium]